MASYEEALNEFYGGEVPGEAIYSALHAAAETPDQRLKWAVLLQLETETKAWLRAPLVAAGLSIAEPEAERAKGLAAAERMAPLPWDVQMKSLADIIGDRIVPHYRSFADDARARGAAEEAAVCDFMVEHEQAQVEFARLELAGAPIDETLAPINRFLKYPVRRARQ